MARDYPMFARSLLAWYDRNRRDLPWRVSSGLPPAYHVLISELMLQQTQVSTVIPYFHRFIDQFPTLHDLAKAPLQKVLRLWQGLGYYSRARNLHALARQVVDQHNGVLPSQVQDLIELPGIGPYSAGAIASLAFDQRAPIVDGNVARVLSRIDCIRSDPKNPQTIRQLWKRSEELLPLQRPGDFNSALMELGATVCTPRNPLCADCPVRSFCAAQKRNLQGQIPRPRKSKVLPIINRTTYCIQHGNRWLIERRPETGRWAGLWQFITLPSAESPENHSLPPLRSARKLGLIEHTLSHRRYRFLVKSCVASASRLPPSDRSRKWVTLEQLKKYPLPKPHVLIGRMLLDHSGSRRARDM